MTSERSALRWRKDTALWRSVSEITKVDVDLDAYIDGNLSTQTSLIILDTLEVIVQVSLDNSSHSQRRYIQFDATETIIQSSLIISDNASNNYFKV